MGTQRITRRDVMYYTVTKKKVNKKVEGDSLKNKFTTLPRARAYGMELHKNGNFKSLVNSNGTSLPI
jgi:hypothetical protein